MPNDSHDQPEIRVDDTRQQPPALDLSIVVPTYRSEESLPTLVAELESELGKRSLDFEIVFVNDASPDKTWSVIQDLAAKDERVVGIDLLHNHGQPAATMCGLALAQGQLVATMDDDLEHRPDQLATLLDYLDDHPDVDAVVATWPVARSFTRDVGTWLHRTADRIAWGTPKGFRHTAYRLMRRPVRDALVQHQTRSPVVGPMLHRVSSRVENVAIEHGTREHGVSGVTMRSGASRIVQNFTAGSTGPLKIISGLGLFLACAAFAVAGALLARWAFGARSPSGWLSVMLATIFVGGTNLLAFGILGNYIDVIVREVRRPPRWSIRGTTRPAEPLLRPISSERRANEV